MNFYPIYRNKKLLPWIKWWLIKGNKVMPKHLSEWINSASAITLTGVYKGSPLLYLNLNGNTFQTGTPTPEAPVPVNVVKEDNYININGESYRVDLGGKNLVTPQYVQNAQNVENTLNADGSITSIGTPNTSYYNITTEIPIDLPVGTYTFSIDKTRQYLTALSLQNEGGTRESKYIRIGDKSVTFTTTEKKVKFYFWSYATNGTPVNETIKYQLEKRKYSNPLQSIYCKPNRTM